MKDTTNISPDDIQHCVLESGDVSVTILSLGCITHDWRVPLGNTHVPVLQSFANPRDHLENGEAFMGAIVGRVANRIGGARYRQNGQEIRLQANEGPNQLHGGPFGIGRQLWTMDPDGQNAVRLTHHSADGAQGFPGAVKFSVTIRLEGHRLTYEMHALPNQPTPINLAQHSYYNLMGSGDIRSHKLQIPANSFTPVDSAMLPTGDIASIEGEALDFRTLSKISDADPAGEGFDINLVLQGNDGPAAQVIAPNGLQLKLWTDQPCLQLYTSQGLTQTAPALTGQHHGPFAGLCLELQHFPDSVNNPQFPSIICTPEQPYQQKLVVEIKDMSV
ncbi:MAG: galactose mutarotase [Rhodobacteraceae bacterium]|nr:galactose mutarotase [Paracoccaceae bacterium]